MNISDWLDKKEADGVDVSHIILPDDLAYDEDPEETIFFDEINPCGILCKGDHPYSIVRRFGHWYSCEGQDREAGIHSTAMRWRLFTKDREFALKTAKLHLERQLNSKQ